MRHQYVVTEVALACSQPVCDACHHDRRSTSQASASSKQASQSNAEADDVRRRFGNAKSISSSMFDDNANKTNDYEKQAMLSKFSVSQPAVLTALHVQMTHEGAVSCGA